MNYLSHPVKIAWALMFAALQHSGKIVLVIDKQEVYVEMDRLTKTHAIFINSQTGKEISYHVDDTINFMVYRG